LAAKLQIVGFDISRSGVSKIEARLRHVDDKSIMFLAAWSTRRKSVLDHREQSAGESTLDPLLRGFLSGAPRSSRASTVQQPTGLGFQAFVFPGFNFACIKHAAPAIETITIFHWRCSVEVKAAQSETVRE
jgi:hypothetical protein